jgi:hypothetical protein
MSTRFARHPLSGLLFIGVVLLPAACGGFFRMGKDCPRGAVVVVANRSQDPVDVILIHERAEIMLGVASPGRTVFALPDGTSKGARFKSRRTRAGPKPAQPGAALLLGSDISYQVQCR